MKRFNEIIHYEPLTLNQIEKLSTHFNRYVQPGNQTKSGKHSLVCYTTVDREGAITEAETMMDSLQMLDHDVTAIHWSNAQTFAQDLKCNLERIKTTCCFLTVCVMAHGSPGAVRGDDGSILEVNQILQLVNESLPYRTPAVPVVLIFQFCQNMATDDMDMARKCAPPPPPIDLTRPHTVLLMSTVIGGTAFRGAYTGELAYQLRHADGKTSIAEMHEKLYKE